MYMYIYLHTHTHTHIYIHIYIYLEVGMATHSSILTWRTAMDRGAWQDTAHGVTESDTTDQEARSRTCSVTQSCLTVWRLHGL